MKSLDKQPFTDKRIGLLLADVVKVMLGSEEVSFKESSTYSLEVSFKVSDEQIIIVGTRLMKVEA